MPQQVPSSKLAHRSNRLKLPVQKKPYYVTIDRGLALGYRRTQTAGTWVMRVTKDGVDWTQAIAKADDREESNEKDILTYGEAQTRARELARGGKVGAGITVAAALDRYKHDLENRGGEVRNVSRARHHLTDKLAAKPISALTKDDLKTWRDGLRGKLKPSSVNRTIGSLRAALNLVAEDSAASISNREAWKSGLKSIEDASEARNVILTEQDVRVIIGAAYRYGHQFGEVIEVLAVTGTRLSQAARLRGEDVQADFVVMDPETKTNKRQPRVMMPVSRKGRGKKKITHRPVPLPDGLARRLSGRAGPLLTADWNNMARHFKKAIEGIKLSQPNVTAYALRHTSIVRQIKANVPIRVVAALHDTSVEMIERNYSKYIADVSDDLARPTLPETIAEVITLNKGVSEVPG